MDFSVSHETPLDVEEDEWDTEGYVIPSLGIGEYDLKVSDSAELPQRTLQTASLETNIYLGPHGAPPSQAKMHDLSRNGRKQRLKHKLKEADKRTSGFGRENKVKTLQELVGGREGSISSSLPKGSAREWLDPFCQESQFEKRQSRWN